MKIHSLLLILLIFLLGTILLVPDFLYAQAPPPLPSKPTQNPIDGGLAILAAAGGAYAVKKLREKKE